VSVASHWATALNAYLNEARVDQMFEPFKRNLLTMQLAGCARNRLSRSW